MPNTIMSICIPLMHYLLCDTAGHTCSHMHLTIKNQGEFNSLHSRKTVIAYK